MPSASRQPVIVGVSHMICSSACASGVGNSAVAQLKRIETQELLCLTLARNQPGPLPPSGYPSGRNATCHRP